MMLAIKTIRNVNVVAVWIVSPVFFFVMVII